MKTLNSNTKEKNLKPFNKMKIQKGKADNTELCPQYSFFKEWAVWVCVIITAIALFFMPLDETTLKACVLKGVAMLASIYVFMWLVVTEKNVENEKI